MAAKPRAIGYVRVSTAEQTHGFGLEIQERAIREWAREAGYRLLRIHSDAASGSNGLADRDGLAASLDELMSDRADALVVYRLDRLARDLVLQETTIGQLATKGKRVISVTEPDVDSSEPTRKLVRQILGAIAEYERALIRARMQAGAAAKKARGGYAGGRPRYGTRAESRELVDNAAEQRVVTLARKLRDKGLSYRAICAELEKAGHKPRRASRWQPAVVREMLLR